MSSLSKIGSALLVIFIIVLLALLVEILYLFLRRREFHRRFTINVPQTSSPSKETLYFLSTWNIYSNRHSRVVPTVHTDVTTSSASDHDPDQTRVTISNDQLQEEDRLEEGGIGATHKVCLNSSTSRPLEEEFSSSNNHHSRVEPTTHEDASIIILSASNHVDHDQLCDEDRLEKGETRVKVEVGLKSTTIGSMEEEFFNEETPFSTPCSSPPHFFTPSASPTYEFPS